MRYRLGLGVAVGVLVALTVAAVTWATFLNTRAAIIRLTNDRVRELLVQTGARVQGHMLAAVPAVELSRMLARDSLLPTDRTALARHFVLVLRANPTFSGSARATPWRRCSSSDAVSSLLPRRPRTGRACTSRPRSSRLGTYGR